MMSESIKAARYRSRASRLASPEIHHGQQAIRNHLEMERIRAMSTDRPTHTTEMVASEQSFEPHPLVGLNKCWHLHCKKSLDAWVAAAKTYKAKLKRRLARRLIRWTYDDLTDGEFSGDFCLEEMGTFTFQDVARSIAAQKNFEAQTAKPGEPGWGCVWEVKGSGVNCILPFKSGRYGVVEYPGTNIDAQFRARQPEQLVSVADWSAVAAGIDQTLARAKAVSASL